MRHLPLLLVVLMSAAAVVPCAGKDFDAAIQSAETAFKSKDFAAAERKYAQAETLAENNKQKAEALFGQANVYGKRENWAESASLFFNCCK